MGNSRETSSEEGKYNEGMGLSESLSTMQRVTSVIKECYGHCTHRRTEQFKSYRLIVFVVEGTLECNIVSSRTLVMIEINMMTAMRTGASVLLLENATQNPRTECQDL
eukprot:scaffold167384_cov67-Attheya_sp.AAC.1